MSGFEEKSDQYMAEMQQTHEEQLVSLRKNLTNEIENKPKKWSKDLIDCRRSLENVAKQASSGQTQLYREAQQIKQVADALHEHEKDDMNTKFNSLLCAKVRNLEKKQQAEIADGLKLSGTDVILEKLQSIQGHDSFLIDSDSFSPVVQKFLEKT